MSGTERNDGRVDFGQSGRPRLPGRPAWVFVAFALAYGALSEFGMALRLPPGGVAAFWPAAGLAAATATFTARRQWTILGATLFTSCLLVNLRYNGLGVSVGFSAANTLEPFVLAWLYQEWYVRFRKRRTTTVARVPMMAVFAGIASSVAGALGATVLSLTSDTAFLIGWRTWIASDVTGIVLCLPIAANLRARSIRPHQTVEAFAACAALAATALVLVARSDGQAEISHSIYLLLPPLIWIAVRLGPRQTAIAGSVLGFAAVWATAEGYGPFATSGGQAGDHVLSVQLFLVTMMLSAMAVTRSVDDRRRAAERQLEVERTLAERELEVAQLASERERHELEAQLLHSQRLEALGRLAGGIAHDFNNLLGVIRNYASLALRQHAIDDAARDDLARIADAAARGSELTRRLLLFSRGDPESGGTADATAVAGDVVHLLSRSLGAGVELRFAAQNPAPARISAARLEQALVNLVLNAADALAGGGVIDVSVTCREGGVEVAVVDSGCGMTSHVRTHAFEPFFTTKAAGVGSGLGLSIVYGIVERAGGQVRIDSEPGRGTAVRIQLAAAGDAVEPVEAIAQTDTEGLVAVVDDDDDGRALMVRLLEAEGIEAVGYADAKALVAAMERSDRAPIAVVTDVVMPGTTGPELAARLWDRLPTLPVVFVSGFVPEGALDIEEVRATYLAKPFDGEALAAAVRSRLGGSGAAEVVEPAVERADAPG